VIDADQEMKPKTSFSRNSEHATTITKGKTQGDLSDADMKKVKEEQKLY
jgi:hypothetical protein